MTYKNYDSLELQQKVNEIDNKCEKSYVDEKVNKINSSLEEKANKSEIGSPLTASTVAEMTDTSKVYVYTGNEEGYTSGNWYSYNGTSWVSGGVYNAIAIGNGSIDYGLFNDQTKYTTAVNPYNLFTNSLLNPNIEEWILEGNCEYQLKNINGFNSIKVTRETTNSYFYKKITTLDKNSNYIISCEYFSPTASLSARITVFLFLKGTYVSEVKKSFDIQSSKGKIEMIFTPPTDIEYDECRIAFSNHTDNSTIYYYKPLMLKEGIVNKSFSLHETVDQIYNDIQNKYDEIVFNPNNLSGDKGIPSNWYNLGDYCSLSSQTIDNFPTLKCYSDGELTMPYKTIYFDGYTGDITSSLKIKTIVSSGTLPVNVKITHMVYENGATVGGATPYSKTYTIYDSNVHTISITTNVTNCTELHACFEIETTGYDCYINQLTIVKGSYTQKHSINSYFQDNNTGNSKLFEKSISLNGDSITQGAGYKGGYGKIIAERNSMTYSNIAVNGATIAAETYSTSENADPVPKHWISRSITNMPISDYNLVSGGFNDYWNSVSIGEITSDYSSTFDDTTFCGGMESVCKQMVTRFMGKKYGFIITHKINDTFYPYGNQTSGKYEKYYEKMVEILNKWSIPYIDLFKYSGLNVNIQEIKNKYTYKSDGTHPNEEGYKVFYVDKIENWMLSL